MSQYDAYGNLVPAAPAITPSAPTTPPAQFNFDTPTPGYTPSSWQNLIAGNSDYMGFKLSASERQDIAAANRKAALRTLAVRYGGIPQGFQDPYGDLDSQTLQVARDNPYSNWAQEAKAYSEDVFKRQQGLGSRGMTQSGELPFELGQADYAHGGSLYDMSNQFGDAAGGAIKDYAGTLSGLRQEQINAIRAAAASVYSQGYRGAGDGGAAGGGAGGAGDLTDFLYDAKVPGGYSIEEIYAAAQANAPAGQTPGHLMNQGQVVVQNGKPGVMIKFWDNSTGTPMGNTIWIPLPDHSQPAVPPDPNAPRPRAAPAAASAAHAAAAAILGARGRTARM